MDILVTGGAGFIGTHIVPALAARGHRVTALDVVPIRSAYVSRSHVGSVLDTGLIDDLIQRTDLVVHLAGVAMPELYGREPKVTMDANLRGTISVVEYAARYSKPILFASSSEIYGSNRDLPWSEESYMLFGPLRESRWCYAISKAAAEHYIRACRRECALNYTIARLFNVYGPGLKGRVVDRFIERALRCEPIQVYGDGQQTRCFTYISDCVEALMCIIDRGAFADEIYNVGNPAPTRILDLAHLVLSATNSASKIEFIDYESVYAGFQDVRDRRPNIDKLNYHFGWIPKVGIRCGLRMMVEATAKAASDGTNTVAG
jgi:UDP-glucose 4-epimerase